MPTRALLAALGAVLVACSSTHAPGDDGSVDDLDTCSVPADCVVVPASCCGSCGAATRGDAVAVSVARVSDHRSSVCGDDLGCPACFMEPDPTLLATCDAGHCALVDLQTHPATECAAASDCRVRAAECCECSATISESTVVAVADAAAFEALVCEPGAGCPECAPVYPDTFGATCDGGRCAMIFAGRP